MYILPIAVYAFYTFDAFRLSQVTSGLVNGRLTDRSNRSPFTSGALSFACAKGFMTFCLWIIGLTSYGSQAQTSMDHRFRFGQWSIEQSIEPITFYAFDAFNTFRLAQVSLGLVNGRSTDRSNRRFNIYLINDTLRFQSVNTVSYFMVENIFQFLTDINILIS